MSRNQEECSGYSAKLKEHSPLIMYSLMQFKEFDNGSFFPREGTSIYFHTGPAAHVVGFLSRNSLDMGQIFRFILVKGSSISNG